MQNSQHQTTKDSDIQCIPPVVITPVFNGIISGISSVIAVYFFKPVWDKITKTLNTNKNEIR